MSPAAGNIARNLPDPQALSAPHRGRETWRSAPMLHDKSVARRAQRAPKRWLADVGLADYAGAQVSVAHGPGLLKRLEVARRALALKPRLVLFDEIMAGSHARPRSKVMTDMVAGSAGARHITVIWVEARASNAIMKAGAPPSWCCIAASLNRRRRA